MTDQRDFDRTARAWLDLMPDEAPDRVFANVLQAVESVPQERPPLGLGRRRFLPMQRLSFAAAVGVAGILAVAGLLAVRATPVQQVAAPSSSLAPTAFAPQATPAIPPTAAIPDVLRGTWIWHPTAGQPITRQRPNLLFGDTSFSVGVADGPGALVASAGLAPDGSLQLVQTSSSGDCRDVIGRYHYALSTTLGNLVFTPVDDTCGARTAALAGSWAKMACLRVTNGGCLGRMEAGTYASQFIDPRLDPGEPWHARYGALVFSVVDGWANATDYPTMYTLVPEGEYLTADPDDPRTSHSIVVATQPVLPSAPCAEGTGQFGERSVAALVAGITANPALLATDLGPTEIGGLPGQTLTIRLKPSYRGRCSDDAAPSATYLTSAVTGDTSYSLGLTGREIAEVILLDLGGGDVVAVVLRSSDPDRFEGDDYAAHWVLGTMSFPG